MTQNLPIHESLQAWARGQCLPDRWGLALSGGADSTALLLAAHALWPHRLIALHVNHGLQDAAADFEQHCQALCERLAVPLVVLRVDASAAAGQSPEDAARRARYAALRQAAQAHALNEVWLAQHQDDQLETLLLALSRGAGVAGLAAMPERALRGGVSWVRPLLGLSSRAIRDWLAQTGEPCCDDPSNLDLAFTRNRIRHQAIPGLRQVFPGLAAAAARSAAHMAQAQALLDDLARIDVAQVGLPPSIRALQGLAADRQANVLRYWLKHSHDTVPSSAQMAALLRQLAACQTRGHRMDLKVGRGKIKRSHDHLQYEAPTQG